MLALKLWGLIEDRLVGSVHVSDEVKYTVGVAALVIIPRHHLYEVISESDTGLGIEARGERRRDEVGGDHGILGVS